LLLRPHNVWRSQKRGSRARKVQELTTDDLHFFLPRDAAHSRISSLMTAEGTSAAVKNQDLGPSGSSAMQLNHFSVQGERDMTGLGTKLPVLESLFLVARC